MALSRYKFGDLIELAIIKNKDNIYGEKDAIGVNIDKIILPMRGDIQDKHFEKFNLVPPGYFAYNPRGSRKLGLGFNDTKQTYIITFNDNVFRVKESAKKIIDETFLFMYLSRKEWDRKAEFISWGSSTEVFDWKEFCEIEIDLPPIEIQRKYVAIYKALKHNLKVYQSNLDDLKLVCDAYIENLRKKLPCEEIGKYIEELNERNSQRYQILGISKDGFIIPKQNTGEIENYKVFSYNNFVYSPPRINVGSIGLYKGKTPKACSPIYVCFKIKDEKKLNPEYLLMWLNRKEFFRSTDFFSIGSVRNNFSFDIMSEVKIPIPKIETQEAIANVFKIYFKRQALILNLKDLITNICPILIRGAIKEANETK